MNPESIPTPFRRIVLTGFMGAGKSTVGRLLAARLNWEFLDLDAFIESRTGLTVPTIFSLHGEPHFRQLETEALASALRSDNLVLALGGGTPEILANRLLLEQAQHTATIFLDAPFSVLYDRCLLQAVNAAAPTDQSSPTASEAPSDPAQSRPNLADPTVAETRFLTRQPLYRLLAHHTIDTSALTTDQTVSTLLTHLHHPKPHRHE
jgi:shikimate kinase